MGCSSSKQAVCCSSDIHERQAAAQAAAKQQLSLRAAQPEALAPAEPFLPPSVDDGQAAASLFDPAQWEGEAQREQAVQALGMLDTPTESRFDDITRAMAGIFRTPMALITLISEDRVWFKSRIEMPGCCVQRDGSWCNYVTVPDAPEVLITEDATKDARFAHNPYVVGAPFIRFYAGAPVIGSDGMRLGTLCVMDSVPRTFSAELYAILSNFAHVVSKELERDMTRRVLHLKNSLHAMEMAACVERAVHNAKGGLLMVDTRSSHWRVLFASSDWAAASGQGKEEAVQSGFWEQFDLVGGQVKSMEGVYALVAAGQPASIQVQSKTAAVSTGKGVDGGASQRRVLHLRLLPASTEEVLGHSPVGIPSWVASERVHGPAGSVEGQMGVDVDPVGAEAVADLASCFWFVSLDGALLAGDLAPLRAPGPEPEEMVAVEVVSSVPRPETPKSRHESTPSSWGSRELSPFAQQRSPSALPTLKLGPLIGSSRFSRVWRAHYNGKFAAAKAVDGVQALRQQLDAKAAAWAQVDHPNVVQTITHAFDHETDIFWVVMQHCNRGTLIDAAERGWLREERTIDSPPDLASVVTTLRDVAAGLAHLHGYGIAHGNLTGCNVLLDKRRTDGGRLVARICGYGLARLAKGELGAQSRSTASHMAPELLRGEDLTFAADIWSLGVLTWELYHSKRAYAGLSARAITKQVNSGGSDLRLPDSAPQGLQDLLQACLRPDKDQRPSADAVLQALSGLLAELHGPEQGQEQDDA